MKKLQRLTAIQSQLAAGRRKLKKQLVKGGMSNEPQICKSNEWRTKAATSGYSKLYQPVFFIRKPEAADVAEYPTQADSKTAQVKYSEHSVEWEENGKKMSACLLFTKMINSKQEYKLYIWEQDTGKSFEEALNINLSEKASKMNQQANKLPEFVYSGKNKKMQVICDYIVRHETPKRFNVLENDSGGEMPACFHLKK